MAGTVIVDNDVLTHLKMSSAELKLEVAVYLYDKKRLTMGQAKRLAGLDQISFQKELAKRDVYIHYDMDDFEKDLKNLNINL